MERHHRQKKIDAGSRCCATCSEQMLGNHIMIERESTPRSSSSPTCLQAFSLCSSHRPLDPPATTGFSALCSLDLWQPHLCPEVPSYMGRCLGSLDATRLVQPASSHSVLLFLGGIIFVHVNTYPFCEW